VPIMRRIREQFSAWRNYSLLKRIYFYLRP
jgi:hypothetical protein